MTDLLEPDPQRCGSGFFHACCARSTLLPWVQRIAAKSAAKGAGGRTRHGMFSAWREGQASARIDQNARTGSFFDPRQESMHDH
ncbi:hypothetical protein O0882_09755 [Janthinobacterium sp. SUN073]|uniref:hypothetical protein n=1 Tax=Janthinobacterium sp. SUN073 TaxID=3004102 RepID=UPI0025B0000E|nr:hypothetical protein [Janthinobacterium sp. SUN073]MDN2696604.1 hypothetical protein [Janthinobacterium sp. SUN073]